jgi:hypothetical protein
MRSLIALIVSIASIAFFAASLSACGGECGVNGENCSDSYKEANNITYSCCSGLRCSPGAISGVPICQ